MSPIPHSPCMRAGRNLLVLSLLSGIAVLAAACSSDDPTDAAPTQDGAPGAETTAAERTERPGAPTVEVELTEAGFRSDGREYSTATTTASEARAALTSALGEPGSATPIGDGPCQPGTSSWGELELIEFSESFWYFSLGPPGTADDSVADRVRTDGGVALGDPIESFTSAHPATAEIRTDRGDTAYWADSTDDGRGLLAFTSEDGSITSLSGGAEDPSFIIDC